MPILLFFFHPGTELKHKLHINQKGAWPFYMDHCKHDGKGKDETLKCPWLLTGILHNNLEKGCIFIKVNLKKQRIFYIHYYTLFTHNIKAWGG